MDEYERRVRGTDDYLDLIARLQAELAAARTETARIQASHDRLHLEMSNRAEAHGKELTEARAEADGLRLDVERYRTDAA